MFRLRLGFDATILTRRLTGVGIYTKSLISALLEVDPKLEIVLFAHKKIEDFEDEPRVEKIVKYGLNVHHFLQFKLPHLLKKHKIDIFHGPNFYLPLRGKIPKAVTVHDLSAQFFPGQHTLRHRLSQLFFPPSLRKADRIISVSRTTANELTRFASETEAKTRVVHNGIDPIFAPVTEVEVREIREEFYLPERFILFVGTLEPRKNVGRLVEAYARVKERIGDTKLVIAGGRGWQYNDIFARIDRLCISDDVLCIGYIPFESLPALYSAAHVFAYPSLYEGFGLPPLEAAACGTPVLTSNLSSMPEVMADAAVLIDPMDTEGIAEGLFKLSTDDTLRSDLILKGFSRAAEFSWKTTARKTLEIYRELL